MTAPPGSHDGDVGLPDYVGGWMAHGHRGYHGYAWYRRAVAVPAGFVGDSRADPRRGARIVRCGPVRVLALVTLASTMAALCGGELLDPSACPGIWLPFGIGVSRTQCVYANVIPLLAVLIVRTLTSKAAHRALAPAGFDSYPG